MSTGSNTFDLAAFQKASPTAVHDAHDAHGNVRLVNTPRRQIAGLKLLHERSKLLIADMVMRGCAPAAQDVGLANFINQVRRGNVLLRIGRRWMHIDKRRGRRASAAATDGQDIIVVVVQ